MKLSPTHKQSGFTLSEMLIAVALASRSSPQSSLPRLRCKRALTRSTIICHPYAADSDYRLSQSGRQTRIHLTTSADQQTVNVTIPNYIIESGDSDATPATIGMAQHSYDQFKHRSGKLPVDPLTHNPVYSTVVYSINGDTILRTEDPGRTPRCH